MDFKPLAGRFKRILNCLHDVLLLDFKLVFECCFCFWISKFMRALQLDLYININVLSLDRFNPSTSVLENFCATVPLRRESFRPLLLCTQS
jgi:hypothetical protein